MKVPPARADSFAAAPPGDIRAILIYGPDLGLVRERAEAAAIAVAGSLSDPFNTVEFTPAALKDEPSRLTDEACALSMMGGRRVVRLRDATDGVTGAATDALASNGEALVIIEAGDLNPRSKLRALFEKADGAAAIACYMDEGPGLDDLVRKTLGDAGMTAGRDVVSWIAGNLGSDRMVSRMELEKLVRAGGDRRRRRGHPRRRGLCCDRRQSERPDNRPCPRPVRRRRADIDPARGEPSSVAGRRSGRGNDRRRQSRSGDEGPPPTGVLQAANQIPQPASALAAADVNARARRTDPGRDRLQNHRYARRSGVRTRADAPRRDGRRAGAALGG
jgi:hypothetical protein